MANPTEPFTPEEIDEAVRQARDAWAADLTPQYRNRAIGYWMPFLLARIVELETVLDAAHRLKRWTETKGKSDPLTVDEIYDRLCQAVSAARRTGEEETKT